MTGSDLIVLLKKQPVGVACGVISVLCGVTLYLGSDSIEVAKAKAEEVQKQNQVMLTNVRNSAGLSLAQQTAAMQQAAKQLESRLVKANQLATNLQYFYRLESDTGVKLTDVRQNQVGRAAGAGLYIGIPYSVTFQGSFKQVMEFLQRLEGGKHFSKYSTVSFNKAAGAETSAGLLSVSLNIELLGTP